MKYIVILLLFIAVLAFPQKKKETASQPVKVDSTSIQLSKTEINSFITQQRQQLREKYLIEDAKLEGQQQLLNAIAPDSVRVKK